MAKRKVDPPKPIDRSGPDPSCGHCKGRGIYPEFAAKDEHVRIGNGVPDFGKKPLPCCKCWGK